MIGQTIAHYQIIEHLGTGGMGEVYLAVDSKLDRKVALKFLPAQMSAQPDAKARFLQEARAASALNHPNICTIHDIQEHDGRVFIVMEYVEGQTLRERTTPFSLKQVIEIGIQIADGLAAAHERGIVHRDIKTENIMLRKDGIVQIMDFGLAKLRGASRLTKEGSTIGTVGYMSPEQVQGLDADHRTDLFSLGVVLYELLGGQMPFKGVHETAIMYEIVNVDPQPLSAMRPDIDPELDRILLDCLQKDPDERCQSAKEVARDLRRFKVDSGRRRVSQVSTVRPAYSTGSVSTATMPPPPGAMPPAAFPEKPGRFMRLLPWGVALVAVLALLVATDIIHVAVWKTSEGRPGGKPVRFAIPAPPGHSLALEGAGNLAVSPDGRQIAFGAVDSLQTAHIWLRPVDSFSARMLPGTEDGYYPFWSPDGRYIGFFTRVGKLKRIDINGGPPLNLCDVPSGRGGSWNSDGTIVYSPNTRSGLFRVSSAGGVPAPVTPLDSAVQQMTHRWPWFLPDGNQFLYLVRRGGGGVTAGDDTIYVGSLDGSVDRELMACEANAAFANGHLLFTRDQTLMASRFDPKKGEFLGEPFPLADEVYVDAGFNSAVFSASANGTLAYLTGEGGVGARILRHARNGEILDTISDLESLGNCGLSPDGSRLAVDIDDDASGNTDIWVFDLTRGVKTRLTFDPAADMSPVWSPDGRQIYFASSRTGKFDIYRKNSSGTGEEELVIESKASKWPISLSSDARTLIVYGLGDRGIGDDIWSLPLDPESGAAAGELTPFQQTEFDEDDAHLSPDGRWLAYACNETGRYDVYVRPFPGPGGKWQISTTGGDFPAWRSDGRELYYISAEGMAMAVEVDGAGASLDAGEPRPLFPASALNSNLPWAVSGDGQEFILVTRGQGTASSAINVIVNWNAEIEDR